MKYKYFLRGFGFGILFATLILMCALAIKENMPQNNSSKKDVLSSEVKENEKDSDTSKQEETSTKEETTSKEEETTSKEEETSSDEVESTSKEEITSDEVETTSKEEESSSESDSDISEETSSVEMVVFTLSGGMSSNQVAQALKDLGVVDSASEFNSYMEKSGIAKRLRIGVYQIPKNATYSEIGNILVKKN
ncbi:MAG: hypothetical protein IJA34_08920 [Lachnospiraceae bacterium]|nr:hypothetical protein [Lachnospiraceae bacterium]